MQVPSFTETLTNARRFASEAVSWAPGAMFVGGLLLIIELVLRVEGVSTGLDYTVSTVALIVSATALSTVVLQTHGLGLLQIAEGYWGSSRFSVRAAKLGTGFYNRFWHGHRERFDECERQIDRALADRYPTINVDRVLISVNSTDFWAHRTMSPKDWNNYEVSFLRRKRSVSANASPRAQLTRREIRGLKEQIAGVDRLASVPDELRREYESLQTTLARYPQTGLLPTRLGNTLRAFEDRADSVYRKRGGSNFTEALRADLIDTPESLGTDRDLQQARLSLHVTLSWVGRLLLIIGVSIIASRAARGVPMWLSTQQQLMWVGLLAAFAAVTVTSSQVALDTATRYGRTLVSIASIGPPTRTRTRSRASTTKKTRTLASSRS